MAEDFLSSAVRTVLTLAIIFAIWFGMVFALPHTMIFLTMTAMIWYFARSGKRTRFSPRSLFVFTTGIVIITATGVLVPAPMLGGAGGVIAKQVVIEVENQTTRAPIISAEVALTSRVGSKTTNQHAKTNMNGTAKFRCQCIAVTKKSIFRTWTIYKTEGWLLGAKASGYEPSTKIISDVTVGGEGGDLIALRIELIRKGDNESKL